MGYRHGHPISQEDRERIEDYNIDYCFLRNNGLNAKTSLKVLGIASKEKEMIKKNGTNI